MEGDGTMPVVRRPSTLPFVICLMAMMIVIVGGTIRIHDAGESCPDWPQCFGTWGFDISEDEQAAYWAEHPDEIDSRGIDHRYTVFEIFTEWFHRFLVGVIALPILFNVFLMHKKSEFYGSKTKNIAIASAILLFGQALAGMVTVEFDNEDWTVALHLSLASIFTALFIYQFLIMRVKEGKKWKFLSLTDENIRKLNHDVFRIVVAIGILLVLGAWVSSTSGGEYNKACSVGFPEGWPQCQGDFLPSVTENGELVPGVIIQMIHRLGAAVVGIVLFVISSKMREYVQHEPNAKPISNMVEMTTGFWLLNVMIGGMYILFAKADEFPELLSLLHLVVGVTVFLFSITTLFMIQIAKEIQNDTISSGDDNEQE
jgi:cytochrome c oxidase assembly protein subunit 15